MSPRRMEITHAAAEFVAASHERQEALRAAAEEQQRDRISRAESQRQIGMTMATVPAHLRLRGSVTYDHDGRVRQSFSCGCDKPAHHNPYAGIIEPTRLELVDPDQEARKLRERVDRARPQTPPAAKSGGGGRTPHTGRPMRR